MKKFTTSIFCFTAALLMMVLSGNMALGATAGDYRTAASGNWNTLAIWEICTVSGTPGTWAAAAHTPTSADGIISIRNTHIVTVAAIVTVDQVVVDAGGQITVNNAVNLTIANGTGDDLIINGTVSNNGTITVNSTGSIITNGTLNIAGTLTMTASSIVFTVNNGGSVSVTGSANFGNNSAVFFNINSGGSISASGSGYIFCNSTSTFTIAGNLTLSDNAYFYHTRGNGGTSVTLNGTATLSGNSYIELAGNGNNNMAVNNGSSLILGPNTVLKGVGDFTMASGSSISIASTNGIVSGTTVSGNIQNTGGIRIFDAGSNYTYNGTLLQSTGTGLPTTIITGNVKILNLSGVTLTNSLIENGILTVDGLLIPGAAQTVSGTGTLTGTGIAQITKTGGASNDFTDQYTISNKTLTNLTVEFAGTSAQKSTTTPYGGLSIKNTGGVTLGTSTTVAGNLLLNSQLTVPVLTNLTVNGTTTINTAESLHLKSDASGTASFIDNGTINGTGTAKIERYLTPYLVSSDWKFHFISSPVGADQAIMPGFQTMTNTTDDFFMWRETTNEWINTKLGTSAPFTWNTDFGSGNGAFVAGQGYLVSYPSAVTKNFKGKPYSNTTGLTVSCTNTTSTGGGHGWNLIGNPFPSALDWDYMIANNLLSTNLDKALYYYDNSAPRYRYYIPLTGGIGPAYSGGSRYIPAMQGFMVHVNTPGTTESVTFKNAARTHTGSNIYYKDAMLTANVLNLKVEGNGSRDDARVCFYGAATLNFDSDYDAYKLFSYNNTIPELYSVTPDNTQVAINTLPLTQMNGTVPLGFIPGTAGTFTFSVEGISNFSASTTIYLKDKKTGTVQKLNDNPSYSFTSTPGDDANRFLLLFSTAGWYQDYVKINPNNSGESYYWIGSDPSYGTQLAGNNFGNVSSLVITGCDMRYWSDPPDRAGGSFFYKIMSSDGNTQIIAPTETIWNQTSLGGNDYQGLKTIALNLLNGLTANTQYQLHIWAKSWGTSGDSYLSNFGANYVATFTYSPTIFTGTGDWTNAANWSSGVPSSTSDAIISGTATITTDVAVNSLTITSGYSLTVNSDKSLTVGGILTNSAGNAGLVVKSGGSLIESTAGIPATVERAINGNEWHLISSPVADATAGMFIGKYLQSFYEPKPAHTYDDVLLATTPLTAVKGFALWGDAAGFTVSFTGPLNAGSESNNTLTRSGTGTSWGWNLVSNPYPSYIDWLSSGIVKGNINNAIYFHVDKYTWAAYNGGVGTISASQYIAPCQGFFVQVTDGYSNGALSMDNTAKVHNTAPFYKNSANNLLRLQVAGNENIDEAIVRFLPEATTAFDGNYDACKLFGDDTNAVQIYTISSEPLSINALPEITTIPVGIRAGSSGVYTIAATEVNDLPNVSLEDTKTGIYTDLLKGSYSFSFSPGENEQRFKLHFSAEYVNELENSFANIYSNSRTVYVDLKENIKGNIYIYSICGELVTTIQAAHGSNKFRPANAGNYIVKVITGESIMVKKVFIQ